MTPVFADTSYFIALLNPSDAHHADAREFSDVNVRPFILTSAIVLELGASFSKGQLRQRFRDLMGLLGDDTELVHVDEDLQQRGLDLFYDRTDKNWSLTDCISFVLMKDRELTDAATTDVHFRQAGFSILVPNVGES